MRVPYPPIANNIIMIQIEALGSGFDIHRIGKDAVYVLGVV